MIVADTSALISCASVDLLDTLCSEFDVHTTTLVIEELEATAEYTDTHGDAAETILETVDNIRTHDVQDEFTSSRVDHGEGSCALLANEVDAEFVLTDDLRALPELQTVTDATVAISPIVLRALVERDVLDHEEARANLDDPADQRDWLGAPIYRRATRLFD
jgi:predicted nucleic acid-binding protein